MSEMSRRRLLAASAIATATSVFSTTGPALANNSREEREERARRRDTVPPPNRGIILYTVRDVVSRAPDPSTGLQGGFRFVFEQLSAMGYKQVEFAGYNQSTAILGRQI